MSLSLSLSNIEETNIFRNIWPPPQRHTLPACQRDTFPLSQHDTLPSSSCSSPHRPFCVALLWILSSSVPCGFFPLGDSVLSVLFHDVVESFRFRAVWILSTRRLIVVVGLGVIVIVVVIAVTILVGYIPIVGFSFHVSAHACRQRRGLVALLSLRIIRTIRRN